MTLNDFEIRVAREDDVQFAETICREMEESAKARGTGIAKRSPEYVASKIRENKAVIALHRDGAWAGFSYIESWGHGDFVANSGLIVNPVFRRMGLAKAIKTMTFFLSLKKFPDAKLFGLTTGLAVMNINNELGYKAVTYSELTDDEEFWKGCRSCVNYPILQSKERRNCLCTAMLFDPAKDRIKAEKPEDF
ncbi:MAG: GNAT family N-acetyltransferase [Rikenellaceae bacterium]|jgi:hypothetical protein|nr:GNAT family N-acetyltransferase [Rikenellaceae bacterium]